jgi:hypothetical protein
MGKQKGRKNNNLRNATVIAVIIVLAIFIAYFATLKSIAYTNSSYSLLYTNISNNYVVGKSAVVQLTFTGNPNENPFDAPQQTPFGFIAFSIPSTPPFTQSTGLGTTIQYQYPATEYMLIYINDQQIANITPATPLAYGGNAYHNATICYIGGEGQACVLSQYIGGKDYGFPTNYEYLAWNISYTPSTTGTQTMKIVAYANVCTNVEGSCSFSTQSGTIFNQSIGTASTSSGTSNIVSNTTGSSNTVTTNAPPQSNNQNTSSALSGLSQWLNNLWTSFLNFLSSNGL